VGKLQLLSRRKGWVNCNYCPGERGGLNYNYCPGERGRVKLQLLSRRKGGVLNLY